MKFTLKYHNNRKTLIIMLRIFLIVLLIVVLSSFIRFNCVIISAHDHILLIESVDRLDEFEYYSIHSLSHSPIKEKYLILDDGFMLKSIRYKDQGGAGMPEESLDDAVFSQEGEWFVIDELNRELTQLNIFVHERYENSVTINNKQILLYEYFQDKEGSVTIQLKKVALLKYVFTIIFR